MTSFSGKTVNWRINVHVFQDLSTPDTRSFIIVPKLKAYALPKKSNKQTNAGREFTQGVDKTRIATVSQ